MRHERVLLGLTQTLFHSLFDTRQTGAVLVLGQLAHAAHAAVAQVVDVIDFAAAIAQVHQDLDHGQDVLVGQHHGAGGFVAAHAGVELHAAHARQVVRVRVVEQAVEQGLHRVFGRWLARTHHAVDGDAGGKLVHGLISTQRLGDVGTLVQLVGVDALQVLHIGRTQLLQQGLGELFVGLGDDLAGVGIHDVLGHHTAHQEVFGHADVRGTRLLELAGVAHSDALVLGHNDLARLVGDVETGDFATQTLRHEGHLRAAVHQTEVVVDEEVGQDGFRRQTDGLEQDGHGHLAAAVDAEEQHVLGVEFEVQPGTAVRDDARREQQLARAVRLALVVLEEHAGRTVELRHDHALGTVDDERAFFGHQGHFAHVDLLLLDFLDHFGLAGRRLTVVDDQLDAGAHSRREGQTPGLALAHVERRFGEVVLDKLHLHKTVVGDDGERGFKRGLQAFVGALLGWHTGLQEGGVGVLLHLQQVRNLDHVFTRTKTLADAFAFGVGIL